MPFLVQCFIIIVSVLLAGQISRRLGQPSVLGQLLVGVFLGPALLGWLQPSSFISEVAEIGVILLMFLAGLETNFADIKKTAVAATLVAVGGVALPFVGGWGTATIWGFDMHTAIFVGVLLVATSVSISVQTLRELGRLKERAGVTILAAAVLDDVLGIIVLSLVLGTIGDPAAAAGHGGDPVGILLLKMLAFFVGGGLVGLKVLPHIVRWVSRFEASTAVLAVGISLAMGFAYVAEVAGLAGIIGAYLCGLVLSGTEFKGRLMHEVEDTAFAWFVPFFYVSVGLTAQFTGMSGGFIGFVLVLAVVAIVTKMIGSGAGALLSGFKPRQALGVGSGMVARGEVGLIVAHIGMDQGLINQEIYTGMVLISLVTTLVTPPLLKIFFAKEPLASKDLAHVD